MDRGKDEPDFGDEPDVTERDTPKGTAFERRVADHLRARMGFAAVETGEARGLTLLGARTPDGHQVDMHAIRRPRRWRLVHLAALVCLLGGLAGVTWWFLGADIGPRAAGGRVGAIALAGFGGLLGAAILVLVGRIGSRRRETHVWVECSERKRPVKALELMRLKQAFDDACAARQPLWTPHEAWVFASGGFDADAVTYARARAIRCFEITDGGVVER
jgi:hypothetical protein